MIGGWLKRADVNVFNSKWLLRKLGIGTRDCAASPPRIRAMLADRQVIATEVPSAERH